MTPVTRWGQGMVGLDTNVVLRLMLIDPNAPEQSAKVLAAVQGLPARVHVCQVALAELVWVVSRTFRFGRSEVADLLTRLLASPQVDVAGVDEVRSALAAYQTSRADFADHLIAALNRASGCATTLTFDKTAANSPDFTLLA